MVIVYLKIHTFENTKSRYQFVAEEVITINQTQIPFVQFLVIAKSF